MEQEGRKQLHADFYVIMEATMCKYCNPNEWYEECFEYNEWTGIKLINMTDDDVVIQASGSGFASYRPKYCPECGRRLKFEENE